LYWLSIPFGLVTTWWMWGKTITPQAILWNQSMVQEAANEYQRPRTNWLAPFA
jgi:hypothetical protein